MDEPWVLPLDSPAAGDLCMSGGKAGRLAQALAAGLPVPGGFVVAPWSEVDVNGAAAAAVRVAYEEMGDEVAVAVRSSAIGEDGSDDSFAGAHDSFLDVVGAGPVIAAVLACRASARSARATAYRAARGVPGEPAVAVLVQHMVDATHAGVLFTRDPMGSGEPVIEAVRGRGDVVVAGAATPDDGALSSDDRAEVLALGRRVESLFGGPQDVEWAFDADGRLWLLQSRPITAGPDDVVDGTPAALPDAVVLRGLGASPGVASGPVRILRSAEDGDRLGDGEVLVATTTSPAWVPAMVDAAAIVTDIGGITSHAAIVARELGVPCVVGTVDATRLLADGDVVAVDGSRGLVSRASAPDADG